MSFFWKSLKSFKVIPHSNPAETCFAWFFSLNIEPIFPLNIIAPSLISLALESCINSPSKTYDPATFPTLETLNISRISADPIIFSSIFGVKRPDILFLIKSRTS